VVGAPRSRRRRGARTSFLSTSSGGRLATSSRVAASPSSFRRVALASSGGVVAAPYSDALLLPTPISSTGGVFVLVLWRWGCCPGSGPRPLVGAGPPHTTL
jgi:hypothetical protein